MLLHTITDLNIIFFKYCAVVILSCIVSVFFHEMFGKWWLSPPKLASYWLVLQLACTDALGYVERDGYLLSLPRTTIVVLIRA